MPRVDTTPARRTKRDALQQRLSTGGRSISSARTAAMASGPARKSISAPVVKLETVQTSIPAAKSPTITLPATPRSWRHPDELQYIRTAGKNWDDMAIIRFLVANAFSIPPRSTNTTDPWVHVMRADGTEVLLPRPYRNPLLWVAKFQWTSLELVLTAHSAIRQREWESAKFEILHIGRLCAALLDGVQKAAEDSGVDKGWRCPPFDRALRRYWHDWLIMRDEFVRDFWREFDEEEYEGDVLKLPWDRWVLKDHKGFTVTKQEVTNGITVADFMEGFVVNEDAGTFEWIEVMPDPPQSPLNRQDSLSATGTQNTISPVAASTSPSPQIEAPVLKAITDMAASHAPTEANMHRKIRTLTDRAPSETVTRIPLPGERRRSQASERSKPFVGGPNTSEIANVQHSDVEMPSARAQIPANNEPEASYPSPVTARLGTATRMGSGVPGCTVFRGHSTDVLKTLLEEGRDKTESKGDGREEDVKMQEDDMDGPISGGGVGREVDEDDDLQLLYPDSPEKTGHPPPRSVSRSPSDSPSVPPSRSPSPVPPLSSARFSDESPATVTPPNLSSAPAAYQLALSQSREALYFTDVAADPGVLARLAQAWGEELRDLRAEVGMLRAEMRTASAAGLERRVAVLEARGPTLEALAPAHVHVHPLQHLIAGDGDEAMEVDAPAGEGMAAHMVTRARYGTVDRDGHGHGEMPPRSRKKFVAGPA